MIAPLERTITLTDMVAYAGATWDWHRIHYDVSDMPGLRAPVVDGQMLGALMAEQVLDHYGPKAFITKMAFKFKTMVFAEDTVFVEAVFVEAVRVEAELQGERVDDVVSVFQRLTVAGTLVAEGTTEVRVAAS